MRTWIIHRERNIYDFLLILMCWLIAAGEIGASLQFVRVLIMVLIPFFISDSIQSKLRFSAPLRQVPSYRYELGLFIIWWIYCVLSLYWAIEPESSLKGLLYMTLYFFGFGEILWLASKARKPQQSLLIGWVIMCLTTMPIAINELLNDHHLSMSKQEADMAMKMGKNTMEARRFASVTFGNLNTYNVVLCMTFCMMMINTLRDSIKERITGYLMIVAIVALIAVNSSRASLICVVFGLLVYVLVLMQKKRHVMLLLGGIVAALGILIYQYADLFSLIIMRFQSQGLEDIGRLGVITHGLEELARTYGFGIGMNNFIPTMLQKYHLNIAAPHNLWLEVGVQYGIVILIGYIGMYVRAYKRSKGGTKFNRFAAILSIIPFLPVTIIDSGYLYKSTTWIYLATIYVLVQPEYNDHEV